MRRLPRPRVRHQPPGNASDHRHPRPVGHGFSAWIDVYGLPPKRAVGLFRSCGPSRITVRKRYASLHGALRSCRRRIAPSVSSSIGQSSLTLASSTLRCRRDAGESGDRPRNRIGPRSRARRSAARSRRIDVSFRIPPIASWATVSGAPLRRGGRRCVGRYPWRPPRFRRCSPGASSPES